MRRLPSLIIHAVALFAALALWGCENGAPSGVYQGYVEGDFVYVASSASGRLESLAVAKGETVAQGQFLFGLENTYEAAAVAQARARVDQSRAAVTQAQAAVDQAQAAVDQAQAQAEQAQAAVVQVRANLRDMGTGLRSEELEQISASLGRARTALELSRTELTRREKLFAQGLIAREDLDRAQSSNQSNEDSVRELEAKLAAGKLPARTDRLTMARAEVSSAEAARAQAQAAQTQAQAGLAQARAGLEQTQAQSKEAQAALTQAQWALDQKNQEAPVAGLVFDLLQQTGTWVAAGSPVVSLLPPENIKVRFFVPQTKVSTLQTGQAVSVSVDTPQGPSTVQASISYISTEPEYTPPVIYSQNFRDKLVFLVEARFPAEMAARMHPGQPVDISLE